MEIKQNSLHIKKKTRKKRDLCPVCDYNLYFNTKCTQRIGVLDEQKDIISWICPKCKKLKPLVLTGVDSFFG